MRRNKMKKASFIIAFIMAFTVFNIPMLGYATQTDPSESNEAKTQSSDLSNQGEGAELPNSGAENSKTMGLEALEDGEDTTDYHIVLSNVANPGESDYITEKTVEKSYTSDTYKLINQAGEKVIPVSLYWSSDDTDVATVEANENGTCTVKYEAGGSATITVSEEENELASFQLIVQDYEIRSTYGEIVSGQETAHKINLVDRYFWEEYSDEYYLTTKEIELTEKNVITWSSDDTDVATVEAGEEGTCVVTYCGEGTATISVEVDGNKKAEFDLKLSNAKVMASPELDEDFDYWNSFGGSYSTDLDTNVYFGLFKVNEKKLEKIKVTSWDVTGEDVLTINNNKNRGRVNPLSAGETTVTCNFTDGTGVVASIDFSIEVFDPTTVGQGKYILHDGEAGELNTAELYRVRNHWSGEIPNTISVDGTVYNVTGIMDYFCQDFSRANYGDGGGDENDPIEVTIPENVTSIAGMAFDYMGGIKKFNVAGENSSFKSDGGVLFNNAGTELIAYPANKEGKEYTIPEGVETVRDNAFGSGESLKEITLSDAFKLFDSDSNPIELFYAYAGEAEATIIHIPMTNTDAAKYTAACYPANDRVSVKLGKITGLKTASYGTTSLNLQWNKPADINIKGYKVYQYDRSNEVYEELGITNNERYAVSGLKAGAEYTFMVVAFTEYTDGEETVKLESIFSKATLSTPTKPSKSVQVKLKGSKKAVTTTWTAQNCSAYEIMIATNSKFTKNKKSYVVNNSSASTISKKITKLKKGKKYYVKIRAYKSYGGQTVYGDWGNVKSVKAK